VSPGNDLVSGNVNPSAFYQVYSRNWLASKPSNTLISVNSTGTAGGDRNSGNDTNLSISDNGQVIAFGSFANDLTNNSANANSNPQIFARNVTAKTTTLASVDSAGSNGGNGQADTPVVSSDGSTVVFQSRASDLTNAADLNQNQYDVFAYNLSTN